MAKISKKATTKIIELVQAIDKSIGKNTSFDEAWEIISEYTGIEGELSHSVKTGTEFILYKGDSEVGRLNWDNVFIKDEGTWDWTTVYKDVIEYMMKNKLVKKPRVSKSIKENPAPIRKNNIYNKNNPVPDPVSNIEELKQKKASLYQRIRNWQKKDKDTAELQKEYDEVCSLLKNKK